MAENTYKVIMSLGKETQEVPADSPFALSLHDAVMSAWDSKSVSEVVLPADLIDTTIITVSGDNDGKAYSKPHSIGVLRAKINASKNHNTRIAASYALEAYSEPDEGNMGEQPRKGKKMTPRDMGYLAAFTKK
jgi:hypothetical protein